MPIPGENVQAWNITAALNDSADVLINWAEGMPRADVNNSARSTLAAIAKWRNLQNGSITTLGTGNAQTFTSGIGYDEVPSGLRVLLHIGAALNNAGPMTLEMDGITPAIAVKNEAGRDLVGGEVRGGSYCEFLFDGNFWVLLSSAAGAEAPQCGRLKFVDNFNLSFTPLNGDKIKINGLIYDIPASGIAGLGVIGVFVNGVSGALAPNTTYYVYAFNSAGVITADYSPTAHTTSTTAGNVGTQIKAGDDTRTLIGMVRTNAATQFEDSATARGVISWFNRRPIAGQNNTSIPVFSTGMVDLGGHVYFLAWGDTAVQASCEGYATAGSAPGLAYTQTQLALTGFFCGMAINDSNSFGTYANWSTSHGGLVTEGWNYFHLYGGSPSGDVQQMTFIINAMTYG